jgi:hypothetical protein
MNGPVADVFVSLSFRLIYNRYYIKKKLTVRDIVVLDIFCCRNKIAILYVYRTVGRELELWMREIIIYKATIYYVIFFTVF